MIQDDDMTTTRVPGTVPRKPPELEFNDDDAQSYPPRRVVKQAVLVPVPPGLTTVIEAEWGEFEQFKGAWYAVYDATGKVAYGVAQDEFESTHEKCDDGENTYVKTTPIAAYKYDGPTAIVTTRVTETKNTIKAGDWFVKWAAGEVGVMKDDNFRSRYEV